MNNKTFSRRPIFLAALWFLAFVCVALPSQAHAPNENYVWLNVESDRVTGRFEINIVDLQDKLSIDWTKFGATEQEAITATSEQVWAYLSSHFQLIADGTEIGLIFQNAGVSQEAGIYAQYFYTTAPFDVPDQLILRNSIFLSQENPLHRSLIVLEYNRQLGTEYSAENAIMAFGPHNTEQVLDLASPPELLKPNQFIWQGVLHTLLGYDHVLFLLALLMTAVMLRAPASAQTHGLTGLGSRWEPVPVFRSALWNVLKIVTLFAISHSITLSLAVLGLIDVNARLIETLIALSIVLVALNNIFPRFNERRWILIVVFGLIHGMGFASAMGELQFRTASIAKILIGFNVGIELGQIMVVVAVFPMFFLIRKSNFYRRGVLLVGSAAIAGLAAFWAIERAFML